MKLIYQTPMTTQAMLYFEVTGTEDIINASQRSLKAAGARFTLNYLHVHHRFTSFSSSKLDRKTPIIYQAGFLAQPRKAMTSEALAKIAQSFAIIAGNVPPVRIWSVYFTTDEIAQLASGESTLAELVQDGCGKTFDTNDRLSNSEQAGFENSFDSHLIEHFGHRFNLDYHERC